MEEEWRSLVYPGIDNDKNRFLISSNGRLKNAKTGRIYKQDLLSSGYYSVRTTIGSRENKIHIIIHKAVAYTFISACFDSSIVVNHRDGNKWNNTVSNLEFCSLSDNSIHAYKNGLKQTMNGELNPNCKLSDEQVRYIRENYIPGHKQLGARPMARALNVSHVHVLDIVYMRTRAV